MTTIIFSVEDDIKKRFDKWAKRDKKSKSDVFRDMVKTYEFNEAMEKIHTALGMPPSQYAKTLKV